MDQQLVRDVASALAEIYRALEERSGECDSSTVREAATLVDRQVSLVDRSLTDNESSESNQEFITDLVNLICQSQPTRYQFSLSDNSVLVFNLAEGNIDLLASTEEMAQKWDELQGAIEREPRDAASTGHVGTTGAANTTESLDEDNRGLDEDNRDRLPPPGWEEDLLVSESLLPPFYLPADYDGADPVFLQIVLGHPLRPVLLMSMNTTPAPVATVGEDLWPIYGWPSDIIVWWEDSPEEDFNEAAERALDSLGAKPISSVEIDGEERILYQLPEAWRSGILEDDHPILEAFLEEEEKVEDDLTYVPSFEEVMAEVREVDPPEELIEYDKSRGLEAVPPDPFIPEEEEEVEFEKPELRLVDGVRYHKEKCRPLRHGNRWN